MSDLPRSLAVVASTDVRIDRLYKPIMRKLVAAGVKVYAIAPPGDSVKGIEEAGCVFVPWDLDRRSLNPLVNLRQFLALLHIYKELKPAMAHHYTAKPNVYGPLAAALAGVPVAIVGITGLGQVFSRRSLRQAPVRMVLRLLYRLAIRFGDRMIFQTFDDAKELLGKRARSDKVRVISGGAGVDVSAFRPDSVPSAELERMRAELNLAPSALVVTMASRLLYEKGVRDYIEAAQRIAPRRPTTRFLLVGERDPGNVGSVEAEVLSNWETEGPVEIIGYQKDIRPILAISHVIVHPTFYPEGIPRILIEASAMEKPTVATQVGGVAHVVEAGVNGFLVPMRDVGAIASAIGQLLDDSAIRGRFGVAGRKIVKERYDDRVVAETHFEEYRQAWAEHWGRRRQEPSASKSGCDDGKDPAAIGLASVNGTAAADASAGADGRTGKGAATASPLGDEPWPKISVVVPARNAEVTLGWSLDAILAQEYDGEVEVIVADGSDSPAAKQIVLQRTGVKYVRNPQKTVGYGINMAIAAATGAVVVRCDAHAFLPPGYLRRAVETLRKTGAANVGGRQRAKGTTPFETAVAMAMSTIIGAGDARYRVGGVAGPVDTVYLGAFRRDALEAAGGFDPSFFHNQDYEVNWRLRQHGEIVWFDPELEVIYRPRDSFFKLARQYFNYGRWKAAMLRRHPRSLRARHLAPPILVVGMAVSLGVGALGLQWGALPTALPLIYLATMLAWVAAIGVRHRTWAVAYVAPVLMTMHLCWGLGFFLPARRPRLLTTPASKHHGCRGRDRNGGRGRTGQSAGRLVTKSSTTAGSANVEVSPNSSTSPAAIWRRIRRMILPDRVFGKPGAS